ncbi:hypothetical protein [Actinomadura sp. WMMA1423]|uniref:hypothetical protein n=1 Tax=Actinomadura sp. WMMA1423 TaxID=2591108 RepID=UPI001146576C|nr:hypothetical protein [Actinomadura sp. WMMA1423]
MSEGEDSVETRLKKAVRGYRRATQARIELHEAIKAAAAGGKTPKQITFLIDHEYDVAHVSRIIHGKVGGKRKPPAKD